MKHIKKYNEFLLNENNKEEIPYNTILNKFKALFRENSITKTNGKLTYTKSKHSINNTNVKCEYDKDRIDISIYPTNGNTDECKKLFNMFGLSDYMVQYHSKMKEFSFLIDLSFIDEFKMNYHRYPKTDETYEFFDSLVNLIKDNSVPNEKFRYFDELEESLKRYIDKFGISQINGKSLDNPTYTSCTIRYDDNRFSVSFPHKDIIYNYIGKNDLNKYFFRTHDADDGIYFSVSKLHNADGIFVFREGVSYYCNYGEYTKFLENMIDYVKGFD